jgi:hypothetical protein
VGVDLDYGNGSALTPSGIRPSDYQPGDEKELMDECEALARSVIKSSVPTPAGIGQSYRRDSCPAYRRDCV